MAFLSRWGLATFGWPEAMLNIFLVELGRCSGQGDNPNWFAQDFIGGIFLFYFLQIIGGRIFFLKKQQRYSYFSHYFKNNPVSKLQKTAIRF